MPEYFIDSLHPRRGEQAPEVVYTYVEGDTPETSLRAFLRDHPGRMTYARVWVSADHYHKWWLSSGHEPPDVGPLTTWFPEEEDMTSPNIKYHQTEALLIAVEDAQADSGNTEKTDDYLREYFNSAELQDLVAGANLLYERATAMRAEKILP